VRKCETDSRGWARLGSDATTRIRRTLNPTAHYREIAGSGEKTGPSGGSYQQKWKHYRPDRRPPQA